MKNLLNILKLFGLNNKIKSIKQINSGHINSTYIVIYSDGKSYILQKLNSFVFKNPDKIMFNINLVCDKLKYTCNCPIFLESNNKNYITINNEIWRIYSYIENSVSYNNLDNLNYIFEFGKVISSFHKATESIDTSRLYITIKNFHDSVWHINRLLKLINNKHDEYFAFFSKSLKYAEILKNKKLSLKVTHNDVKCSNVLFDKNSGKGITLIDLDTVMPGLRVHDFGDGARSSCITNNKININKFKAYCKGYFSSVEVDCAEDFFLGMICITSELSARYLYDYLSNENYFSNKLPCEKFQRCNDLIKLSNSIEDQKIIIIDTIDTIN